MTTGATDLQYGDVTIARCLTRTFRQETVYDESGSDPTHAKITIRVGGVVSIDANGANKGFVTGGQGGTTAEFAEAVRKYLWAPRRALQMTVGGISILTITGPATGAGSDRLTTDVNSGPKPQVVEVTRIIGTRAVWVEFEVEVCHVPCGGSLATAILSNRWSMTDDIDENQYTTRVIEGTVRVASVAVTQQEIRNQIIPPLIFGFYRKSIHFVVTTDGLTMKYRIVDQEFYTSAPAPLTKFTGTHTVSTADHGICSLGEIVIRGEAPKNVDKRAVITRCVQIAYSRINLATLSPASYLLEQAAIIEHIHENVCEFRLRVKFLGDQHTKGLSIDGTKLGIPLEMPGYTPAAATPMPAFGTASPAGLLLCYLQSPCDIQHSTGAATATGDASNATTSPPGGQQTQITTAVSDSLSTEPAKYSASHKESLYTYYRVESSYRTQQMKVQLPVAALKGSTGKTSVCIPLSPPVAQRKIVVTAERVGSWPSLPKPKDFTEGGSAGADGEVQATLLDHEITPRSPTQGADSNQTLYAVDAWYLYALDRQVPETASLNSGSLPWDTSKLTDNALPSTTFIDRGSADQAIA